MCKAQVAREIYDHFLSLLDRGEIPIKLRQSEIVGTVQDDPFDFWVGEMLHDALPDYEVLHSGKLTTPDILIRNRESGAILGLEVKKLIQKANGADPRGLTMDFNSCVPCGKAMIKVGDDLHEVPCFYLFALLKPDSSSIVTLVLMDGDFLNYDFNLHKEAKTANTSSYGHGPYGEGSVRSRAMYTYPNLLNSKLVPFFLNKILILKKVDAEILNLQDSCSTIIEREDVFENIFKYSVIDGAAVQNGDQPTVIRGIFDACKKRVKKARVASTPRIEPL